MLPNFRFFPNLLFSSFLIFPPQSWLKVCFSASNSVETYSLAVKHLCVEEQLKFTRWSFRVCIPCEKASFSRFRLLLSFPFDLFASLAFIFLFFFAKRKNSYVFVVANLGKEWGSVIEVCVKNWFCLTARDWNVDRKISSDWMDEFLRMRRKLKIPLAIHTLERWLQFSFHESDWIIGRVEVHKWIQN